MARIERAELEHVIFRCASREAQGDKVHLNEIVDHLAGFNLKVETQYQGNFTIVSIENRGAIVSLGVAKKHPDDEHNPLIGYNRALVRAAENLVERVSIKLLAETPRTMKMQRVNHSHVS